MQYWSLLILIAPFELLRGAGFKRYLLVLIILNFTYVYYFTIRFGNVNLFNSLNPENPWFLLYVCCGNHSLRLVIFLFNSITFTTISPLFINGNRRDVWLLNCCSTKPATSSSSTRISVSVSMQVVGDNDWLLYMDCRVLFFCMELVTTPRVYYYVYCISYWRFVVWSLNVVESNEGSGLSIKWRRFARKNLFCAGVNFLANSFSWCCGDSSLNVYMIWRQDSTDQMPQ